ncbi:MAG TPA: glycosyltransferase family 39 protein [Chloroflexota bacterium]
MALVLLVGITALAVGLRLNGLDRKSVWYDESITALFARQSLQGVLDSAYGDTNPPLYYLVMHVWLPLTWNDFWLRLPSAIFSAGAVTATVLFGRSLRGWSLGLLAGLFTALAPFAIDLGQEARSYGLLTLLTVISVWVLFEACRSGQKRWWAVYVAATIGAVYTHNYGWFLVGAESICALGYLIWSRRWDWGPLASFLAIGAAYLPWLPALMYQARLATSGAIWAPSAPNATLLGDTYSALVSYIAPSSRGGEWLQPAAGWLVGLLLAASLFSARRRPGLLFPIVALAFPIAAAISFSFAVKPIFVVRHAVNLVPLFWLCVAAGVLLLPTRLLKLLAVALVAGTLALSLPSLYSDASLDPADLRQAAALVRQSARPGDLVVHTSYFTTYPFEYYNRDLIEQAEVEDPRTIARVVSGRPRFWYLVNYDQFNPDAEARTDDLARGYLAPWTILQGHSGRGYHLYLAQPIGSPIT